MRSLTDQFHRDAGRRRDVRPAALGRQGRNALPLGQGQAIPVTQRQPAGKRELGRSMPALQDNAASIGTTRIGKGRNIASISDRAAPSLA